MDLQQLARVSLFLLEVLNQDRALEELKDVCPIPHGAILVVDLDGTVAD